MEKIRVLTLNLWNIQPPLEARMATAIETIRELQPDIVALQEVVEDHRTHQQLSLLAEALAAEPIFGVVDAHCRDGAIGNAVLSRLPVHGWSNHRLPGPARRDLRSLLVVEVATPWGAMAFGSTHFTWEPEYTAARLEQAQLAAHLLHRPQAAVPSLLCGDLNMPPEEPALQALIGRGQPLATAFHDAFRTANPDEAGHTWSSRNTNVGVGRERDRRLDYILIDGLAPVDPARMVLSSRVVADQPGSNGIYASDHFGVLADLDLAGS